MNSKGVIYPFTFYNQTELYGNLQIFITYKWITPYYLNDKNARKICSFFYRTFGTITLEVNDFRLRTIDVIQTIDCPLNASDIQACKFDGEA